MSPPPFDLLILCGGQGSRMQGQDKPLLPYQGRAMVSWVASSVPKATKVWISANRNIVRYTKWGSPFLDTDVHTVRGNGAPLLYAGPLVGILGGLERSLKPWLLVSPGDTPCLSRGWCQPLLDAVGSATSPSVPGAVIHDGMRQQNLHLLLATSLAPVLRNYINNGGFRVWQWLEEVGVVQVAARHPHEFKNINTESDLSI